MSDKKIDSKKASDPKKLKRVVKKDSIEKVVKKDPSKKVLKKDPSSKKVVKKKSEKPKVKEPVVKEPVVKEPVVEEPKVKEPVVEEPVVETPDATNVIEVAVETPDVEEKSDDHASDVDVQVTEAIKDVFEPKTVDPKVYDIIDRLHVFTEIDFENFTVSQLPPLVIKSMELVETIKGLSGLEKKTLVTEVVRTVVDESNMSGSFEPIILPMIPVLIDELVMISDGKMKINTGLKSKFVVCFAGFKSLFSSCKGCKGCKGCKKCKCCK